MARFVTALVCALLIPVAARAADKIRLGFPDLAAQFIPLPMAEKRDFFQRAELAGGVYPHPAGDFLGCAGERRNRLRQPAGKRSARHHRGSEASRQSGPRSCFQRGRRSFVAAGSAKRVGDCCEMDCAEKAKELVVRQSDRVGRSSSCRRTRASRFWRDRRNLGSRFCGNDVVQWLFFFRCRRAGEIALGEVRDRFAGLDKGAGDVRSRVNP